MSLDFYLEVVRPAAVFESNITHNLGKMARAAGIFEALWASEQFQTAADLIPILRQGIAAMEADPARFKAHDAKNGWGTYEQFLPWVRQVLAACVEHPEAVPRSAC